MKVTYEALRADPELVDRLHASARYERADAMSRMLVAALARLFKRDATLEITRPARRSPHRTAYC